MVRPSRNVSNARRADFAARMAAGKLTDAERAELVGQLRDALRQADLTLRDAHGSENGTERRCCREGTCEESRALAEWAASRGAGSGGRGQVPARPTRHVRLTRDGAQAANSAFQRAADDVEAALPNFAGRTATSSG